MGSFDKDGCNNKKVQPVYIKVKGNITEIFPLSYDIGRSCALIGSPTEMGAETLDHKVIKPATVSFTGILKREAFQKIQEFVEHIDSTDVKQLKQCTFYGKYQVMDNMLIEDFHEIGNPNRYDAVEVSVRLHEYLEAQ